MNGKGSKLRKGANLQAYWNNYDDIFKRKKIDESHIKEEAIEEKLPDTMYSEYLKIVKRKTNN